VNKFNLDADKGIILCKAKLTNKKSSVILKLAVDTGASATMVSIEAAMAIGINPSRSIHSVEVSTASGMILAPIIKIPSFKCFGVEVKNLQVFCHTLPPQSPVEGLLGLNFLKDAKVIIDFSRNIIEIPHKIWGRSVYF